MTDMPAYDSKGFAIDALVACVAEGMRLSSRLMV